MHSIAQNYKILGWPINLINKYPYQKEYGIDTFSCCLYFLFYDVHGKGPMTAK